MSADLVDAIGYLPFPLGVTATPEHVVVALNTPGRTLLGDAVGRPVCTAVPHPPLRATLDAANHQARPGTVQLPMPPVKIGCAPIPDGVLLHMTATDVSAADRARSSALQKLTGAMSWAATPAAIARLVAASAGELLGADGAGVFARTGAMLTALHQTGWEPAIRQRYHRIPINRGRPLSDAVLGGAPVWLENAEQWRLRYPEMAPVGTSGGYQATACLPMRVDERDLGALVFSFHPAQGVLGGRARVPAGGHVPVRAGARPGPPAGRGAGGPGGRRAAAGPDDVPRGGGPPDGGVPVARAAAAPVGRPRRTGDRGLVRRPPHPQRPRRAGRGDAGARGVRADVRRGGPRLRRAAGDDGGGGAGQRPALRAAAVHRRDAADRAAPDRPPGRAGVPDRGAVPPAVRRRALRHPRRR